jgi:hypothetical protein
MLTRLLHSMVTLGAIIVAYELYVLTVVPLLEPPHVVARKQERITEKDREYANRAVGKYQRLLSAYFAPDHWSQIREPKVIESGAVMLVLDDYDRHDDNRVDMTHFALVIFPTPRDQSAAPPRDAIILEAPQGAHLQFDDHFHPERGQIGQIVRGVFPGPITIRSDMKEPGPDDDLLVETSDVEMNSKLLVSPNEVRFRLGQNVGSGRELEIRLLKDEQAESRSGGMKVAGVETLEIRREVKLRAFLGTSSLLPGGAPEPKNEDRAASNGRQLIRRLPLAEATSISVFSSLLGKGQGRVHLVSAGEPASPQAAAAPSKPPVDVTCTGPFHFDFQSYIASFDRDVEVVQLNPEGPSDQMSCQQLDIHFGPKAPADDGSPPSADFAHDEQKDLARLTAESVIAQGYPVVVVSPSRQAEARANKIELQIPQRKVILSGGQDVSLAQGQNILRAPTIQYQQPDRDATTKIGNFHADGPGTLQYVPNPKKPDQVFTAAWKAQVELGRNSGQPVFTLTGRPQLIMTGMGELTADQVIVYLREVAAVADGEPANDGTEPAPNREKIQVRPDRLNAIGQVEVNSPQLLARTRELKTTFHEESPLAAQAGSGAVGRGLPGDRPADNSSRLNLAPGSSSPNAKTNQIAADEIDLVVALRGTHPAPTNLVCNGHVAFRDVPKPGETEQLDVRGGQLVADQLDTAARMIIHGAAANEPPGSQLTEIKAHGMTMHATDVQLDEAQNRLWVDGPGVATITPTHDLMSKSTAAPTPFDIHWQGGLNFDGRQVVFDRQITVVGADDRLWCDQLIGTLAAPIKFGQRVDPQTARLAEVECRGSVIIDHLTRDATGTVTSHDRGQLNRLTINQLTNRISGDGPGVLRSTSSRDAAQFNAMPATATTKQPAANPAQLHFLRVDFQRGLDGNILTKEIAFHDRVHTIYGPVDAWEQELDVNHPETLPPDTVTLSSDDLSVNEDPIAARNKVDTPEQGGSKLGPVQLRATGSVQIDGQSPGQGVFAANAASASYEQIKELFVLEGTDRQPATLRHQSQVGGQLKLVTDTARRIQFNRLTGQVQQDGVHLFEYTPGDPTPAVPKNALAPPPRLK